MPLSQDRNFQAAPAQQNVQNGRMVSSGGYDLGPSNTYTNSMMNSYRDLQRYRQQRQYQQQQYQQQYQEPAPDTTGWVEATPWEKQAHKWYERGEALSDPLGYGEAWERTKQNMREGHFNPKDFAETFGKFAISVGPSMVGGFMMHPQYWTEAMTGHNLNSMYEGKYDPTPLRNEQKAANLAYMGLDYLSFVPGVGAAGTLARTGARAGARVLGKQATREAAAEMAAKQATKDQLPRGVLRRSIDDRVAAKNPTWVDRTATSEKHAPVFKDTVSPDDLARERKFFNDKWDRNMQYSPSERLGQNVAKAITGNDHPYIGSIIGAMGEEAGQEYLQTMMEDIRGVNGDPYGGRENISLERDLEGAMFGALGGGIFGGVNVGVNKGIQYLDKEHQKRVETHAANGDPRAFARLLGKAYQGDEEAAQALERVADIWSANSDNPTDPAGRGNAPTQDLLDAYHQFQDKRNQTYGGFSATALSDGTVNGQDAYASAYNVIKQVSSGDAQKVTNVMDGIFGDEEELQQAAADNTNPNSAMKANILTLRARAMEAAAHNNVQAFADAVNDAIKIRESIGEEVVIVYVKQPMNSKAPFKLRLRGLRMTGGSLFVSEEVMSAAGGDFDGDMAQIFDPEEIKGASWFYDSLFNADRTKASVDWGKGYLDIGDLNLIFNTYEVKQWLAMCGAELPEGGSFSIKIGGETFIAENNDELPLVITQALKKIKNIRDDDKRSAAFSSFVERLWQTKWANGRMDVSMFLGFIRDNVLSSLHYKAAVPTPKRNILEHLADSNEAKGTNRPVNIQGTANNPTNAPASEYEAQIGIETSLPSSENQGELADNFRGKFWTVEVKHYKSAREGTVYGESEVVQVSLFDALLSYWLEMEENSDHAAINLNKFLYREILLKVTARMRNIGQGTKLSFDRDAKLSDIFNQDLINEINDLIEWHNLALQRAFADGGHGTVPGGFTRDRLTGNSVKEIAKFLTPVIEDDIYVSEILESFLDEDTVTFLVDNDINLQQPLRNLLEQLQGRPDLPSAFIDTVFTKSDGDVNDDMRTLFIEMKKAYDDNSMGTNRNLVKELGSLHMVKDGEPAYNKVMSKEEFRKQHPDVSEDVVNTIFENDEYDIFQRYGYLMGWEIFRDLGWNTFDGFRTSPLGRALIDAKTASERVNIAFSAMFAARTRRLTERALSILNDVNNWKNDLESIMKWRHVGATNNNPIWQSIGSMIDALAADVFKDTDISEAKPAQALEFAKRFIQIMDLFTNYKGISLETKLNELKESYWGSTSESNEDIPWFIWLRAGWRGHPHMMNMSLKISKADIQTSTIRAESFNNARKDYQGLEEQWASEGTPWQTQEATMREMGDEANVEIDRSISLLAFMVTVYPDSALSEKARSDLGLGLENQAITVSEGEQYTPMFGQYTTSLTNAKDIMNFGQNRKLMMDVFWGNVNPKTGKLYTIPVTDAKTGRSMLLDTKKLFGVNSLDELKDEKGWEKRKNFLRNNPFWATYFYPARVEMVEVGDVKTVSVSRKTGKKVGENLREVWINANKQRQRYEVAERTRAKSILQEKWERKAKAIIHKSKAFNVLWVLATPHFDQLDSTNVEEVNAAANASYTQVENFFLWLINEHIQGRLTDIDKTLSHNVAKSAEFNYNELIGFESRLDELLAKENRAQLREIIDLYTVEAKVDTAASDLLDALEQYESGDPGAFSKVDTIDPGAEARDEYFDSMSEVYHKEKIAREYIAAVYGENPAIMTGAKNTIKSVDWEQIEPRIPESKKKAAKRLYYDDAELSRLDVSRHANLESEDSNGIVIRPRPTVLKAKAKKGNNVEKRNNKQREIEDYRESLIAFFDGTPWNVNTSDIDEYIDQIKGHILDSDETAKKAEAAVKDAEHRFWANIDRKIAQWRIREQNSKINVKDFEPAVEVVRNSVDDIITRIDEQTDFLSSPYRQAVQIGPDEMPLISWQLYNPANLEAAKTMWDAMKSEDSELGIGVNGMTPEVLAALAFVREYYCEGAMEETNIGDWLLDVNTKINESTSGRNRQSRIPRKYIVTIDDIEGYDGSDKQDIIKTFVEQVGGIVLADNQFQITISPNDSTRLTSVDDILGEISADKGVNFTAQQFRVRVYDISNEAECSSGVCRAHKAALIDWLLELSQGAQEDRLMKIKKWIDTSFTRIKGRVKDGTVLEDELFVLDASVLPHGINPNEILNGRNTLVEAFAESMRQNATADAISGHGTYDKSINMGEYADQLAKLLTPCVTVVFKNGDMATIGIEEIYAAKHAAKRNNGDILVKDPLCKKDADGNVTTTTHDEFIDWSQIDRVEMIPLSFDEWASHIVSSVEPKLKRFVAENSELSEEEKKKAPWSVYAKDAMFDWSERNRYCQETGEDNHLTVDRILANVSPLTYSRPYTPTVNVLPTPRARFFNHATIPRASRTVQHVTVSQKDLEDNFSKFHVAIQTTNGEKSMNVVYVESDMSAVDSIEAFDIFGALVDDREIKPINDHARAVSDDKYIFSGAVVAIPNSGELSSGWATRIVEKAMRSDAVIVVPEAASRDISELISSHYGIGAATISAASSKAAVIDQDANMFGVDPKAASDGRVWVAIDFKRLNDIASVVDKEYHMPIGHGMAEPLKMFCFLMNEATPTADSVIWVTDEMADFWTQQVVSADGVFDLPFEDGEWHLLDKHTTQEQLEGLRDDLVRILAIENETQREEELASLFKWKKEEKAVSGDQKPPINHTFIAQRTLNFVEKALVDKSVFSGMTNVIQDDVIGIAFNERYNRYVPVLFGHDHRAPTNGADVQMIPYGEQQGSVVKFTYDFKADSLEELTSIKAYLNLIPGQKAQAIFRKWDAKLALEMGYNPMGPIGPNMTFEKGIPIPLYGIMDWNTQGSRIGPRLLERLRKLTLFAELRQYKPFDLIQTDDPNEMFEGPAKEASTFKPEFLTSMLAYKGPMRGEHKAFWELFASGELYLKGHNPLRIDERGGKALQALVRACLNKGVNPAMLFSSVNHYQIAESNGNMDVLSADRDEFVTEEWDRLLSETTGGIDLDTVMAYCNLVDETFCPDRFDANFTDNDFMRSQYHTDGMCHHRVSLLDPKTGETKEHCAICFLTTVGTDGSVVLRNASNSAAVNSRIKFVQALRNGPRNPREALDVLQAVREHFGVYSKDEIAQMFDTDDEYWENMSVAAENTPSNLMIAAGLRQIPRTIFGKKKADIREILDRHSLYYGRTTLTISDPAQSGGTLDDAVPLGNYENVRKLDGCNKLSYIDYCRLIKAVAGWTPTKEERSANQLQPMPHSVYIDAHKTLVEKLSKGEFPISMDGTHRDGTRVFTGYVEPEALLRIIKHLKAGGFTADLSFKEIAKGFKRNIEEMKSAESPLSNMEDDKRRRAIWDDLFYADAIWNGIDEKMVLDHQFSKDTILIDVALTNVEKLLDGRYPEKQAIYDKLQQARKDYQQLLELDASLMNIPVTVNGENAARIEIQNNKTRETVNRIVNTVVQLRQMMAMMSPVIMGTNIGDTFKGNLANAALNKLGRMGVWSPYRIAMKNRVNLIDPNNPEAAKMEKETLDMIYESQDCQDYIEARMMAQTMGRKYLLMFEQFVRDGGHPADFIEKYRSMKFIRRRKKKGEGSDELIDTSSEGWFENTYAITMRIGSGHRLFKRRVLRNFMQNFLRIAGEYGAYELEEGGVIDLQKRIHENPREAFQMMWSDYNEIARIAWEQTQQNSIAHETALSFFLETMMKNHPILKFLVQGPGGITFLRASINITRRVLRNVIPGISASEYIIQSMIADANLENNPMLSRILSLSGVKPEKIQAEFAGHPEWKVYTSLREAILVDLCHMTLPAFGFVFAAIGFISGAIEPPDDDDLKQDYWEWSFFGVTFGQQWWLQDLIGPILPWVCYCYTFIEGKPDANVLLNGVEDFINMSPFVHLEDFVDIAFDPESVLEAYDDDVAMFSDAPDGKPDMYMAFCAQGKAASLSFLASLVTPKIFRDIETYMPTREVSYNRAYVYDADGNHVYNPDGTPKTRLVTYEEAQIRRVTRNNFMLGFFLDAINGAAGNEYIGYTRDDMPAQRIYDSAQLQFEHTMSVWDYETDSYKSDEEIEATCAALLVILDQNDDMDELWREGFYLDKPTKDALSAYIWGLYQGEIDDFNDIIQSGQMDYVVLGNGDWNEGQRIASEMWEAHYAELRYYEDLYYNKLCSDELNQGLVAYERYNTTYKQDANGDWYATGFQQHAGMFSPIMPNQAGLFDENADLTTGMEGSWATRSVVTGQGMYDQNGKPYRGLIPIVQDDYEWLSFDDLAALMGVTDKGNGNGNGDGNSDANNNGGDTKGGWGYAYSRGGGGGGRGSSVRLANRNYPSTSKAQPAYAYNYNRRVNPHNTNFARPNFANTLTGGRIYDAQLDYLRPNFETKGSREAYRRQDF